MHTFWDCIFQGYFVNYRLVTSSTWLLRDYSLVHSVSGCFVMSQWTVEFLANHRQPMATHSSYLLILRVSVVEFVTKLAFLLESYIYNNHPTIIPCSKEAQHSPQHVPYIHTTTKTRSRSNRTTTQPGAMGHYTFTTTQPWASSMAAHAHMYMHVTL